MSQEPDYCVYILTNHTQTVLYVGVTSDLEGRAWEHANGESGSKFTRKYHANTLVYYEQFGDIRDALDREKQLKGWTRAKKEALIRTRNPTYVDLGPTLELQPLPAGGRKILRRTDALAQDDRKKGDATLSCSFAVASTYFSSVQPPTTGHLHP